MTIQSRMTAIQPYIDRPPSDYRGVSFDGTNALAGYRDRQPYISTPSSLRTRQRFQVQISASDYRDDPVTLLHQRGSAGAVPVIGGVAGALFDVPGVGPAVTGGGVSYGPADGDFIYADWCAAVVFTTKATLPAIGGSWMYHNFLDGDNEVQLGIAFSSPERPVGIAGTAGGAQGNNPLDSLAINSTYILCHSFDGTNNSVILNGRAVESGTPGGGNTDQAGLEGTGLDLMSNSTLASPSDMYFHAYYFRRASEITLTQLSDEVNQRWGVY